MRAGVQIARIAFQRRPVTRLRLGHLALLKRKFQ